MTKRPSISGKQCRAARVLMDWEQSDLCEASGASVRAISDFETGKSEPRRVTLDAIEAAFMVNGWVFLESGGIDRLDAAQAPGDLEAD